MSKRYPGNFITGNPVALSQTSNNGIWDVTDVSAAVAAGTWQEPDGIYEIPKSLRFRNTGYFTRAPATTSNRTTWTVSFWAKPSQTNATRTFFGAGNSATGGGTGFACGFYNNNKFRFSAGGGVTFNYNSTAFFRDPSAWYHFVVVWDSTNAVTNDRIRVWVNGERITSWSTKTDPSQNAVIDWNYASATNFVGTENDAGSFVTFEGYMAEFQSVDGIALDPSYFGYTDSITNIWQPKKYTGAYGTNGFYLPFTEPAATSGTVNAFNLGRNFAGGTNYIRYSQDGSQTSYGYTYDRATNTINNVVAPDGTTTGNKLTADGTASNTHRFYCGTVATPAGSTQTVSIYLKYANCRYVNIENWNGAAYQTQTFDILNGVPMVGGSAVSATGFTYQFVGNGWYRVSVPLYAGSTNVPAPSIAVYLCDASGNVSWNGDSTSAVYWWGAQLNLGTTADPYLKTASTTAPTNDWTPTNISLTAGTSYDSMVDSPTNVFTSATDIGGVVPGNYCTLNPINKSTAGGTLSEGNLRLTTTGGNHTSCGTIAFPPSGKWYFEAIDTVTGGNSAVGILQQNQSLETNVISANINMKYNNMADNATFGFAVDMDNLTYTFYKSNAVASTGSASTGSLVAGVTYVAFCMTSGGTGSSATFNFGQRAFTYAPPTGYKSLNTTNLQALGTSAVGNAAITPNKWFDINRYAGTGTARDIQNSGFQPDIVMVKKISGTDNFEITDSGRGDNLRMYPNTSEQESAGGISLRPDGFNLLPTFGTDNESGFSYIAWQWKQSPISGLNVIPYTGNGVARSISHNLGVAPRFMWIKQRDVTNRSWCVYHAGLSNPQSAFYLDSTAAAFAYTAFFNNTAPSSSNFSLGTDASVNQNNSKYIAYLWAEVPGFSKFGSYAGNGSSDGPFIYLGFKPRWILVRHSNLSSGALRDWLIYDSARTLYNGYNYSDTRAGTQAIISGVPYTGSSGYSDSLDFVSNGFKFKNGASPNFNGSGETYVYAAFAESPFGLNNRAI